MGSGISAVASPLLITELCHPQQRGKLTAVYNTFWYFGSTIAAWTTFGTLQLQSNLSWRLPSLFQFIPSFIQVVLIWFLPESPRFLISRDQNEKALAIMTKYHANGNPESEWLRFEFSEIRASLRLEKESAKSQWKDLFKTRKLDQSLHLATLTRHSWKPQAHAYLYFVRPLLTAQWNRPCELLFRVNNTQH